MPKLLPFLLIVLLTGCAQQATNSSAGPASDFRTVDRFDLVLAASSSSLDEGVQERTFRERGIEGWLRNDGSWSITGPVQHTRLLCGTYQMGIQIGKGDTGCGLAQWSTPVEYGTNQRQCNSATVIHSGGGESSAFAEQLSESNCVRVLVRCSGQC